MLCKGKAQAQEKAAAHSRRGARGRKASKEAKQSRFWLGQRRRNGRTREMRAPTCRQASERTLTKGESAGLSVSLQQPQELLLVPYDEGRKLRTAKRRI